MTVEKEKEFLPSLTAVFFSTPLAIEKFGGGRRLGQYVISLDICSPNSSRLFLSIHRETERSKKNIKLWDFLRARSRGGTLLGHSCLKTFQHQKELHGRKTYALRKNVHAKTHDYYKSLTLRHDSQHCFTDSAPLNQFRLGNLLSGDSHKWGNPVNRCQR